MPSLAGGYIERRLKAIIHIKERGSEIVKISNRNKVMRDPDKRGPHLDTKRSALQLLCRKRQVV
jgi:hypothetical protein